MRGRPFGGKIAARSTRPHANNSTSCLSTEVRRIFSFFARSSGWSNPFWSSRRIWRRVSDPAIRMSSSGSGIPAGESFRPTSTFFPFASDVISPEGDDDGTRAEGIIFIREACINKLRPIDSVCSDTRTPGCGRRSCVPICAKTPRSRRGPGKRPRLGSRKPRSRPARGRKCISLWPPLSGGANEAEGHPPEARGTARARRDQREDVPGDQGPLRLGTGRPGGVGSTRGRDAGSRRSDRSRRGAGDRGGVSPCGARRSRGRRGDARRGLLGVRNEAERGVDQDSRQRRRDREPDQDGGVQVRGEREGPRSIGSGDRPDRRILHLRFRRARGGIPSGRIDAHRGEPESRGGRDERLPSGGRLHCRGGDILERSLSVKGSVKAEEFRLSGSVRIDGGLKAEEVEIDLQGTSKIPTIEAEEIRVKATGGFFRVRGELTADRIEGEEIELEATTAALVKGDEVRIGPHCHIDVVEARELVVHSSSEVRERRTAS